jgi:hypothetical protein
LLPSFTLAGNFGTGTDPASVVVADVNRDGRPDLITANAQSNTVSVLLGNGNGTFQAAQNFATGVGPGSVAVGDFNGDGRLDVVTANYVSGTVSVLLGNGNGTFQAAQNFTTGANPRSLAVADVNGDGHLDLVTASSPSETVSVLLGNGNGTFLTAQNFATAGGLRSVAVADVNGDGRPDIVGVTYYNVEVFLGNGDGTFQAPQNFSVNSHPAFVAVADVNGDGHPDLVTAEGPYFQGNNVSILLGNGDGTFKAAENLVVGITPYSIAVADVNGDGRPDLLVAGGYAGQSGMIALLGNGDGTFQASGTYLAGTSPFSVAAADVNGDGRPDILVSDRSSNTVAVLLNNSAPPATGTFKAAKNFTAGVQPLAVAVADVNGDGNPDLVVGTATGMGGIVSVLLGKGNGTFQAAQNFSVDAAGAPYGVAVADVNGDGRLDIISANPGSSGTVSVLLGNGDGTFQAAQNFAVGSESLAVAVADVNGDGKADLIVTGYNAVSVLLGNGNGTFQAAQNFAVGSAPRAVAVADVNGDGRLDIITANAGNSTVSVLLGNGNGTFQAAQSFATTGTTPNSIAVADVNGDGRPDLVVTNRFGVGVNVFLGNGNGTFKAAKNFTVGSEPYSVAVADINGDGHPDIVTANSGSNNVSVLLGKGNGTFKAAKNFAAGFSPISLAVADVNRDGLPDLAVANGETVSVLLGKRNAATHLQIIAPASHNVGGQFNITVNALTAGGQIDDLYTGTIHFTSSDSSALLPADYTFTNSVLGSQSFTVSLRTPGTQTITVTDTAHSTITGTATITVNASAPPPGPNGRSGRAAAASPDRTDETSVAALLAAFAEHGFLGGDLIPQRLTRLANTPGGATLPAADPGCCRPVRRQQSDMTADLLSVPARCQEETWASRVPRLAALDALFAGEPLWGVGDGHEAAS